MSLVLPSCGEGQQGEDPAQLPSSSPHLQLLVSGGRGVTTDGGQHGDAGSPGPSPGQRALGEKDLAKRGVGEHEVLEGRTHEVCTCVRVCRGVRRDVRTERRLCSRCFLHGGGVGG